MIFKNVLGTQYELVVPLDSTFKEITNLFNAEHNTSYNIVYVTAGHTLSLDSTPSKESLTNDNEVFIVTSQPQDLPVVAHEPHNDEEPEATPTEPEATPTEPEAAYVVSYTGAQVKIAMQKSTNIMFNIIHFIGYQNPFFLSYLAVNPAKAKEHIEETLNRPDFTFIIKGDSVSDDPIKPHLMHVSGDNGYQVDLNNLNYILDQCADYVTTEDSKAHAKETYLLMNRDIRKTIDLLRHPSSLLNNA
jgi:hypothetical protein